METLGPTGGEEMRKSHPQLGAITSLGQTAQLLRESGDSVSGVSTFPSQQPVGETGCISGHIT